MAPGSAHERKRPSSCSLSFEWEQVLRTPEKHTISEKIKLRPPKHAYPLTISYHEWKPVVEQYGALLCNL